MAIALMGVAVEVKVITNIDLLLLLTRHRLILKKIIALRD